MPRDSRRVFLKKQMDRAGQSLSRRFRYAATVVRNCGVYASSIYASSKEYERDITWLFVATLPNSGSTALAQLILSSPNAIQLHRKAEGQWLIPSLHRGDRWDPNKAVNYGLVRAVWTHVARSKSEGHCVVIEKSPQSLARFRKLYGAFHGMERSVVRLTRDPYAVCASWIKRYPWNANSFSNERAYWVGVGDTYGARMQLMREVADLSDLTVSYEWICDQPDKAAASLAKACPSLRLVDPQANVTVKDYPTQRLSNKNEEQVAVLSSEQIDCVREGLKRHRSVIKEFGYDIDSLQ